MLKKIIRELKSLFLISRKIAVLNQKLYELNEVVNQLYELSYQTQFLKRKMELSNPFNKFGKRFFSQTDEDGLTMEIVRRIGFNAKKHIFAEFGVGNGSECNTLILSSLGFKGFWAGNEDLFFKHSDLESFKYYQGWINLDNISLIINDGISNFDCKPSDLKVISIDLDGNDFYFTEKILKNYKPDLFIVEYNALFPPPVRFCIEYDSDHIWNGDDYFGCSLQSYNDLFKANGFFLVCCNLSTGANAFFVNDDFKSLFPEVPTDINQIYVEPNYLLSTNTNVHKKSPKTVRNLFNSN